MQSGDHVDQGHARLHRFAVRGPGHAHQAADCLYEQVVAGDRGARAAAETADRAVDQLRVPGPEFARAESQPFHRAGTEVLHHDVGFGDQGAGLFEPRLGGEVQDDGPFVPVDAQEVRRGAVLVRRRVPGPGLVPDARALHLHHVGAEVGEEHGGIGSREHPGEVGDAQPVQCGVPCCVDCAGPFVRCVVLGVHAPSSFFVPPTRT